MGSIPNLNADAPHSHARIVVVGGANTDVVAFADGKLRAADSNPGRVREYRGGVARNIAENLSLLDMDVHLISAFGGDTASYQLAEECSAAGIVIEGSVFVEDLPGARYVAIDDENHELALAVSDMRVLDRITPAALAASPRVELIESADLVIADTNISAESLGWLAENVTVPFVVDPVSAAKATRVSGVLDALTAFKPNGNEAEAILGISVENLVDAEDAARLFVERGVRHAFVTPGHLGIGWAGDGESGAMELPPAEVANSIGAGDSFVSGVVFALLMGTSTEQAAMVGAACSAITLGSREIVNQSLGREAVQTTMEGMFT